MTRTRLNLLIDAVIGTAFLVTAVTGVVFLLPLSWQHALGLGMPGMLGLPLRAWHWLHDWSGVVAAAGVMLHFALHYRWVVHTARRWLGESHRERAAREPVETPAPASLQAMVTLGSQNDPHRDSAYQPSAGAPDDARLTRRGFVAGVVGVGAALAGGVVLVKAASAVGLGHASSAQQVSTGQGGASGSGSSATGSSGGSSSTGSSTSGSSSSGTNGSSGSSGSSGSQSGSSQGQTEQARVSVDATSCVGCGRCLQTCPASVFAWDSNGRATAQSPGQCILCRRCVRVCPASAITLNG